MTENYDVLIVGGGHGGAAAAMALRHGNPRARTGRRGRREWRAGRRPMPHQPAGHLRDRRLRGAPQPLRGRQWVRLESVQNATDQAAVAAKTICGIEAEYDAVPWFWSNQYDLKLQTVGLSQRHDEIVTRGEPASRSFSLIYLAQGRVIALDCVNAARDYVQGRAWSGLHPIARRSPTRRCR